MKLQVPGINWFDIVVLIVLLVGYVRGRKRGMSEESLDVIMWVLMVIGAGMLYKPLGKYVSQFTGWSLLLSYFLCYLFVLVGVKIVFVTIKRMSGEKLVGSDVFGRLEYPLGILAGMVRFSCMLVVLLALIHARLITDKEYEAQVKADKDLYGEPFFPSLGSIQRDVFLKSFIVPKLKKHLDPFLIEATPSVDILQKRETFGRQKEREIDELITGPKRK